MGVRVAVLRNKSRGSALMRGVGGSAGTGDGLVASPAGCKAVTRVVSRRGAVHRQRSGVSALGVAVVRLGAAGGVGGGARAQAPVVTVRACARVASRTKRATLPARIKTSPRTVALALLAKPNQGERLR
jgi:hypothetical protein